MQRLESTSGVQMGSSFLPIAEGAQPLTHPVAHARIHPLPERYGMPLLELLVVDPEYVFISWEITDRQLADARASLGEAGFERRRLRVTFRADDASEPIASRELYGETGRWFIRLGHPGVWLSAELEFVAGERGIELNSAGPVFVPRDSPIEPASWEELEVRYSINAEGKLILEQAVPGAGPLPAGIDLPAGPVGQGVYPQASGGSSSLRPMLPERKI